MLSIDYNQPRIVKHGDLIQPVLNIPASAEYELKHFFPSCPFPLSHSAHYKSLSGECTNFYYKEMPYEYLVKLYTPKIIPREIMKYLRAGIIVAPSALKEDFSHINYETSETHFTHVQSLSEEEAYKKLDIVENSTLGSTRGFGVLMYDEINQRPRVYHLERKGQDLIRGSEFKILLENDSFLLRVVSEDRLFFVNAPTFLTNKKYNAFEEISQMVGDHREKYFYALFFFFKLNNVNPEIFLKDNRTRLLATRLDFDALGKEYYRLLEKYQKLNGTLSVEVHRKYKYDRLFYSEYDRQDLQEIPSKKIKLEKPIPIVISIDEDMPHLEDIPREDDIFDPDE